MRPSNFVVFFASFAFVYIMWMCKCYVCVWVQRNVSHCYSYSYKMYLHLALMLNVSIWHSKQVNQIGKKIDFRYTEREREHLHEHMSHGMVWNRTIYRSEFAFHFFRCILMGFFFPPKTYSVHRKTNRSVFGESQRQRGKEIRAIYSDASHIAPNMGKRVQLYWSNGWLVSSLCSLVS